MSRAKYRHNLPQLSNSLFLTDGGLETTLIFHEGHELPYFAAFDLMTSEKGRNALRDYYRRYLSIAAAHGLGFISRARLGARARTGPTSSDIPQRGSPTSTPRPSR